MHWYLRAAANIIESNLNIAVTSKELNNLLEKHHLTALKLDAMDVAVSDHVLPLGTAWAFLCILRKYCLALGSKNHVPKTKNELDELLISTFLMAIKLEENEDVANADWLVFSSETRSKEELKSWERKLLEATNWELRVKEEDIKLIRVVYCEQAELEISLDQYESMESSKEELEDFIALIKSPHEKQHKMQQLNKDIEKLQKKLKSQPQAENYNPQLFNSNLDQTSRLDLELRINKRECALLKLKMELEPSSAIIKKQLEQKTQQQGLLEQRLKLAKQMKENQQLLTAKQQPAIINSNNAPTLIDRSYP